MPTCAYFKTLLDVYEGEKDNRGSEEVLFLSSKVLDRIYLLCLFEGPNYMFWHCIQTQTVLYVTLYR